MLFTNAKTLTLMLSIERGQQHRTGRKSIEMMCTNISTKTLTSRLKRSHSVPTDRRRSDPDSIGLVRRVVLVNQAVSYTHLTLPTIYSV